MMRLFIAVDINFNRKISEFYLQTKELFKNEKIKWVDPDNFHLTLKFLGETQTDKIPFIENSLKEIAKNYKKFEIEISGIGVFPNLYKPKVLWIGINKYEILTEIAHQIDTKLQKIGFEPETRIFKPHLTIGRIKFIRSLSKLKNYVEKNSEKFFNRQKINSIILYQSILSPQGAKYNALKIIKLQDNE